MGTSGGSSVFAFVIDIIASGHRVAWGELGAADLLRPTVLSVGKGQMQGGGGMSGYRQLFLPGRLEATWGRFLPTAADVAPSVAEFVIQCATAAVRARGHFTLGVSGGTTPLALFALLARSEWAQRLPWTQMSVFWVDERWVPYTHESSNFGQFSRCFVDRAAQLPACWYPMPVQGSCPAADALAYANALALFFGAQTVPVFDCFLLGLGSDGHTASLFPHSPVLKCQESWVAAIDSPPAGVDPALPRLSLTLPVLNAARNVAFLVSGAQKADVTATVLQSFPTPSLPATFVRPQGTLYWFLAEIPVQG